MSTLKITVHGIAINNTLLKWGAHRKDIRKKLNISFREYEKRVEYRPNFIIEVCRDMFDDFFLIYDFHLKTLKEIEIHKNCKIEIQIKNPINFCVDDTYSDIIKLLKKDFSLKEIEKEKHLIQDLKMLIASDREMGGDGKGLRYLYLGKDISHLQN